MEIKLTGPGVPTDEPVGTETVGFQFREARTTSPVAPSKKADGIQSLTREAVGKVEK